MAIGEEARVSLSAQRSERRRRLSIPTVVRPFFAARAVIVLPGISDPLCRRDREGAESDRSITGSIRRLGREATTGKKGCAICWRNFGVRELRFFCREEARGHKRRLPVFR
jgi:hypothetical protein